MKKQKRNTLVLIFAVVVMLAACAFANGVCTEHSANINAANAAVVTLNKNDSDTDVVITDDPELIVEEDTEEIKDEEVEEEVIETPEEPEYEEYTIQSGDSFWVISEKFYGNGMYYTVIAADNNMTTADYIYAGEVIKIYNHNDLNAAKVAEVVEEEEKDTPTEVTGEATYITYTDTGASSFDGDMGMDDALAIIKDKPNEDTSNMKSIGTYRVTGYDPHCSHCCGKTNGITTSGRQAEFGISVGCNDLPLGTIIYVDGYGYFRVDDRGGMGGGTVDIACPSHDVCYQMTNNSVEVFVVG